LDGPDPCTLIYVEIGVELNCGYVFVPAPPTTTPAPKCNNSSVDSKFLSANYGSAEALSNDTSVPVDWILAWAAAESGSSTGAGWGQSGAALNNQNYFGQKTTNWSGAVSCTGNYVAGWACFSGFMASATSALETQHVNWTFSGATSVNASGQTTVSAAQILTSLGSNAAAAFQAVATAGQDPGNTSYGANVADVLPGVDQRLTCLGLSY
jgi:hypothetical protein